MDTSVDHLQKLATLIRHHILTMTHGAGSGHPTTCFSAVDLMTVLFFKYFQANLDDPADVRNDRLIFSKGHASALLYSLYAAAGKLTKEELLGYRTIDSNLEGHPTFRFPYTEAATGSLGQGLSIGAGEAWAILHSYQLSAISHQTENSSLRAEETNSPLPSLDKRGSVLPLFKRELEGVHLPRVFVLLGDGEIAEGSVWETAAFASHYKLNNLIAIADINRFGQSGETMHGHDVQSYERKFKAFGWETLVIDGHAYEEIDSAFSSQLSAVRQKPLIILAKTVKGKGISIWEGKDGWHNKMLAGEEFEKGKKELGEVDWDLKGEVRGVGSRQHAVGRENSSLRAEGETISVQPAVRLSTQSLETNSPPPSLIKRGSDGDNDQIIPPLIKRGVGGVLSSSEVPSYKKGELVATKKAFGDAIEALGGEISELVVLDGDVNNSLHTDQFKKAFPDRFIQCFIAEQNMVGVATGLAKQGLLPIVNTFSAFLTRAHDQIRMLPLSGSTVLFNGSYGGVSIGKDGPSQMGLEDLALFRNISGSIILYPSDAVSTEKLTRLACAQKGVVYMRTTREPTPVVYGSDDMFEIGGSRIFSSQSAVRSSQYEESSLRVPIRSGRSNLSSNEIATGRSVDPRNDVTIIAAGITVHEALKAQTILGHQNIPVQVIDCYSIKPIDVATLKKAAAESRLILTVEDHYPVGGLGDAVLEALADTPHPPIIKLAVNKLPRSGKPEELLEYCGISSNALIKMIRSFDNNA